MRPARLALAAGPADGVAGLALAIAMAVAWLAWLLPRGFVRGTGGYWQRDIGDTSQYLAGFAAFFSEPWAWPVLGIHGLNFPAGTLATFLDVIPVYAAALKLVVPADRFPFNPYGYWVGFSYVLMAVGAWWIVREARLPRYGALVALTALVLLMPALNARLVIGHISLVSHWLILFALALYLRGGRSGRPALAPWTLVLFGAFYINLYIFVMLGLVFTADVVRSGPRLGWRRAAGSLLLPVAFILASLPLTMLPLPHTSRVPEHGFGFFSMNVLSPLVDGGRLTSWLTSGPVWARRGHYEGYNYLGAGMLLLIAVGLVLRLRHDPGFFRRHRILTVALALATVWALSHRVYAADRLVLQWPVPQVLEWPLGTFRASGRMFWPVGYALACFAVLTAARWLPRQMVTAVLASTLLLQWFDLGPFREVVRGGLARPASVVVDAHLWTATLGPAVRTIYLYPKYGCGGGREWFEGMVAIQRYATERRLRVNTGYIARYHPRCDDGPQEIAASRAAESVYVFPRGETAGGAPAGRFPPGARLRCRDLDFAVACRWLDAS